MSRRWHPAVVVTFATTFVRCASPMPAPEASPATTPDSGETASAAASAAEGSASLSVENNTTFDVRIFVLRAGMPSRVGEVPGMSTVSFELKANLIDRDVRLYATPIGGSTTARTEAIVIRAGQLVMWALDNKLKSFRLSIY